MSVFEKFTALRLLKFLLKRTLFRRGTKVRILFGPLRGFLYVVTDAGGWAAIYGGWERGAARTYERLVGTGTVVYDLGANTGIHTILFSKLVGPGGRVIAFEPLPSNVQIIRELLSVNAIVNVEVRREAISDVPGEAKFKLGVDPKQGSLIGIGMETGEEITVTRETLDNLIDRGLPLPDFVKIDIEGAESAALRGFLRHIRHAFPTFAIDLHSPTEDVHVGKFLFDHGYHLYRLVHGRRYSRSDGLLPIANAHSGWPDPEGVWGTVVAIHPNRLGDVKGAK